MFPEIVAVALPEDTSGPDAQIVLAACTQSYLDGSCEQQVEPPSPTKFQAEVRWLSETQAEVVVRFVEGQPTQSARRELKFQPGDRSEDRYRSLGFAAGSLAGTLAELERIQSEVREQERREREAREREARQEEAHVPPKPPPEIAPLERPRVIAREAVPRLQDDYRLGLQLGSGIDAARMGVALGARVVWHSRWVIDAHGSYATQRSNADGIEGAFVNGSVGIGVEVSPGPLKIDSTIGFASQWQSAERSSIGAEASEVVVGGELAVNCRYASTPVAPFLEFRAGLFEPTDVPLSDDEARVIGPLQLQGIIGISFTPGGD